MTTWQEHIAITGNEPALDEWAAAGNAPCPGCHSASDCKPGCTYDAYLRECEAEYAERGELAGAPREMECYQCGREHLMVLTDRWGLPYVPRKVAAFGPLAEAHRDPTTTYRLECGHIAL